MPIGEAGHPLEEALLLRTLRLNCLTSAYRDIWNELFRDEWRQQQWGAEWPGAGALESVRPEWDHGSPLRAERERRSALVELDVLVAIMLGLRPDELIALYESRFPQLVDYESQMWFDRHGRKLAANFNQWGHGQTKEHWQQFQMYLKDSANNPPPDGYQPPFYKADRAGEYRQAHAAFTERMKEAGS